MVGERRTAPVSYALGIDLGGSSVKAVAVAQQGQLLDQSNVSFDASRERDWARRIRESGHDLESKQGSGTSAIGISAPGLAACDGRSIARMPGRLHGLEGLGWTEFLNEERKNPGAEKLAAVPVLN